MKTRHDDFLTKFKNNIAYTLKEVRSEWPYDYDADFKAYHVTNIDNKCVYFCFSSEGRHLATKKVNN